MFPKPNGVDFANCLKEIGKKLFFYAYQTYLQKIRYKIFIFVKDVSCFVILFCSFLSLSEMLRTQLLRIRFVHHKRRQQ